MGLLITEIKTRGMDSMTKREYEIQIVRELMSEGFTDEYELSMMLKVAPSKIKKLIESIQIRYPQNGNMEQSAKEDIFNTLQKCQVLNDGATVRFILNNANTRSYFENILNKNLLFYDYSFKKDVIVIPVETLIHALEIIGGTNDLSEKLDEINKKLDESKPKITWKDVIKKLAGPIATSVAGPIAGTVVSITVDKLLEVMDSLGK